MLETLQNLDWNFKSSTNKEKIHRIHPYPAKFIPDIPSQLIDELGCPNGVVLDPFCGSGTTLNVAQNKGFKAIGVDLNPIACLISKVKTSSLDNTFTKASIDVVSHAKSLSVDLSEVSDIPNIDHWFKPEIQKNILSLRESINVYKDEPSIFDPMRVALSSILVRVSNQDSDTRYAAVDKNLSPESVYKLFETTCRNFMASLNQSDQLPNVKVINKDILKTTKEDINSEVGLVVTSPPYPNAYEYWLYHKYRMFWLGFDPVKVKTQEIGARAHFFKKNHHTPENFYHQMKGTLTLIDQVLIADGYAAFVVGRSKIHGEIVDNAALIERAAAELNFEIIGRFNRKMNASKKSFNPTHANIKEETIVVLRK
ncbi:DNA methyltransferase C1 [Colwellia sp. KU-HH00111]|uniref:DNA methyltransferase n=1 Tax=Colwellia sp. KU-HH00111 TaxID=3127652 RepID=UPI0031034BED